MDVVDVKVQDRRDRKLIQAMTGAIVFCGRSRVVREDNVAHFHTRSFDICFATAMITIHCNSRSRCGSTYQRTTRFEPRRLIHTPDKMNTLTQQERNQRTNTPTRTNRRTQKHQRHYQSCAQTTPVVNVGLLVTVVLLHSELLRVELNDEASGIFAPMDTRLLAWWAGSRQPRRPCKRWSRLVTRMSCLGRHGMH